ncbi:MAG: hypothetical protein KDA45_04195 [Planctomycetales bacterium]|nr:hypothetical protein [Planctomycetales bacterium]
MKTCECLGWWQQEGWGRQPMRELQLGFSGHCIEGHGVDVVAPFSLTGLLRPDGTVQIVKQYLGRHTVQYVGHYDGEGTLFGQWGIGGCRGDWSIKLLRPQAEGPSCDIAELAPRQSRL